MFELNIQKIVHFLIAFRWLQLCVSPMCCSRQSPEYVDDDGEAEIADEEGRGPVVRVEVRQDNNAGKGYQKTELQISNLPSNRETGHAPKLGHLPGRRGICCGC